MTILDVIKEHKNQFVKNANFIFYPFSSYDFEMIKFNPYGRFTDTIGNLYIFCDIGDQAEYDELEESKKCGLFMPSENTENQLGLKGFKLLNTPIKLKDKFDATLYFTKNNLNKNVDKIIFVKGEVFSFVVYLNRILTSAGAGITIDYFNIILKGALNFNRFKSLLKIFYPEVGEPSILKFIIVEDGYTADLISYFKPYGIYDYCEDIGKTNDDQQINVVYYNVNFYYIVSVRRIVL